MDAWPRTTRGYEADVGLYHIPGERDIYLDAVLSLANPRTYPGCENKAGKVAELWARRKNAEHPVFDRQTGRRLQPFDFCALAFERHGFIAKETKSFLKACSHQSCTLRARPVGRNSQMVHCHLVLHTACQCENLVRRSDAEP